MIAAINDEHGRILETLQRNAYTHSESWQHAEKSVAPVREIVDLLDGVELTPSEWSTLQWFVGWDANANMASILRKIRAAGPAL